MNLRASVLQTIIVFVITAFLYSAQVLAKNAYISNSDSNTVSVIDTTTNNVTTTITGFSQPFGVAMTADGSKAYVGNASWGSVSVIDVATNLITGVIPLLLQPLGVAVTPDGR